MSLLAVYRLQLPPAWLTIIADSMRSIFTEGTGFAETKYAILELFGTGLLFFVVGKRLYKWY